MSAGTPKVRITLRLGSAVDMGRTTKQMST